MTPPSVVTAQVCRSPAAIAVTPLARPTTSTGGCARVERPVAELTAAVPAPARHPSAGGQGTRVIGAGGDRGDAAREAGDADGRVAGVRRAVPELAVPVPAPARDAAGGREGTRVLLAQRERLHAARSAGGRGGGAQDCRRWRGRWAHGRGGGRLGRRRGRRVRARTGRRRRRRPRRGPLSRPERPPFACACPRPRCSRVVPTPPRPLAPARASGTTFAWTSAECRSGRETRAPADGGQRRPTPTTSKGGPHRPSPPPVSP